MDGFGSDFSAGGSGGKIDTGTIMEQVKVQIAVANAQELLQVNLWSFDAKLTRHSVVEGCMGILLLLIRFYLTHKLSASVK